MPSDLEGATTGRSSNIERLNEQDEQLDVSSDLFFATSPIRGGTKKNEGYAGSYYVRTYVSYVHVYK